jgi:hypothetical protein
MKLPGLAAVILGLLTSAHSSRLHPGKTWETSVKRQLVTVLAFLSLGTAGASHLWGKDARLVAKSLSGERNRPDGQVAPPAPAARTALEDAVRGIVKLFDNYPVVAIGEARFTRQLGDLYVGLVRDPEFQRKVNDIVIEFASRHNQQLLDRYILRCEQVPD